MSTIPAWVNFVAGLTCVGLAVNFFAMAYEPKIKRPTVSDAMPLVDGGQWRIPSAEEAARLNIPLTQNNANK